MMVVPSFFNEVLFHVGVSLGLTKVLPLFSLLLCNGLGLRGVRVVLKRRLGGHIGLKLFCLDEAIGAHAFYFHIGGPLCAIILFDRDATIG